MRGRYLCAAQVAKCTRDTTRVVADSFGVGWGRNQRGAITCCWRGSRTRPG